MEFGKPVCYDSFECYDGHVCNDPVDREILYFSAGGFAKAIIYAILLFN
jgi:hypothetical protein